MESMADLFGRWRPLTAKGAVLSERASLVAYFEKEIQRAAKIIGVRLGHYSLSELYALRSQYKDRLDRDGKTAARKYWWAITRTTRTG
jgi:hypothetical protein